MNKIASWKLMTNIFVDKLSTWNVKLLSIGGCITLIMVVMGSLSVYYMSIHKVPDAVIKMLESLRAKVFWGVDIGEKKCIRLLRIVFSLLWKQEVMGMEVFLLIIMLYCLNGNVSFYIILMLCGLE